MHSIVEVSETGILRLPAEILQAIQPHTRFVVQLEGDRDPVTQHYRVILSPISSDQPFWATATPEEWAERWHQWVHSHKSSPGLSDEALRRENIYD